MDGTTTAGNHAEKEHFQLPKVAEWMQKVAAKKQAKKSKAYEAAASLTKVSCCDDTFFSIQCDVSLLFSLSANAGGWTRWLASKSSGE